MTTTVMKREQIVLTPDLAKHLLSFNDYDSQRPIRQLHVVDLKRKIETGLFRFGEVAVASLNGARDRLMNGQHVCSAVIESGKSVDCIFEKFKCDNSLDMSELFRQFEILPRSLKDFVRHEKDALGIEWPLYVASLVVSAAVIDYANFRSYEPGGLGVTSKRGNKIMSKEQKALLLRKYIQEGDFINMILSHGGLYSEPRKNRFLQRTAVAFVMMETWRKNVTAATKFWSNVRDGEMLKAESPEIKYRDFLLTSKSSARIGYTPTSNHEYVYRGHIAWNAFRRRKPTNLAYRANLDPPALV